MWTTENRPQYERKGLRYPTDLTDAEWALVKPLIPRAKRGGRRREVVVRDVLNGILYVLSTACQWRALPKDLPPRSTVHGYLQRWDYDGTLMKIHDALYVACREQADVLAQFAQSGSATTITSRRRINHHTLTGKVLR